MRIGNTNPAWQDALEALLPAAGAVAALVIMLVILIA